MEISAKNMARLGSFIYQIEKDTYPEPPSNVHIDITNKVMDIILAKCLFPQNAKILDVGCGQGPALDILKQRGFCATGIALNDKDIQVCQSKNHVALKMDQSFMDFTDGWFDFVWARHVIEHSIFPYFTLSEFCRVLRPKGIMYMEVPAPETSCHHEANPNHYSVLGHEAWVSLLKRSGFYLLDEPVFNFTTSLGPDVYWGFICMKN
jgi:2-polyprenyl-3-methyl-5-hydroxy-6-metoxy-1,4-benzoquinol methylase